MVPEEERYLYSKMKSLVVYQNGKIIYEHEGKWLHPLLDLERFLQSNPKYAPESLSLRDKVVGKASAMLTARLGIKNVHAMLLSSLAVPVLKEYNIAFTYDKLVERLPCKTEELLSNVTSPDKAYSMIQARVQAHAEQ